MNNTTGSRPKAVTGKRPGDTLLPVPTLEQLDVVKKTNQETVRRIREYLINRNNGSTSHH